MKKKVWPLYCEHGTFSDHCCRCLHDYIKELEVLFELKEKLKHIVENSYLPDNETLRAVRVDDVKDCLSLITNNKE